MMDVPNFLLNAGGVLVGAGISWGVLKSEVKTLKRDLWEAKRVNDEQEGKISALRDRGLNLMFKADCGSLRDECQDRICNQFEEVKKEIRDHREAVATMNREISEFMGYVKATLEDMRGKRHASNP